MATAELAVIVCARDEEERLGTTLDALRRVAFPGARLLVADDGSRDATASVALQHGAQVVSTGRPIGKGGAATLAARTLLEDHDPAIVVLCDGDLGTSAARLAPLAQTVRDGRCDVAIGAFARRVGGGFGVALSTSRAIVRRAGGLRVEAPLSGQRALSADALRAVLPFAPRFGMETGMTIDAARAGLRIREIELDLEHRATGRTLRGFAHRARQLADILAVGAARVRSRA